MVALFFFKYLRHVLFDTSGQKSGHEFCDEFEILRETKGNGT